MEGEIDKTLNNVQRFGLMKRIRKLETIGLRSDPVRSNPLELEILSQNG